MQLKLQKDYKSPEISPQEYVSLVSEKFLRISDPIRAEKQMAYMRHQFEYCGLAASQWYPLTKQIFAEHGMFNGRSLQSYVELCYEQPYREVLYTAIEMMHRMLMLQNKEWINVLERCITMHAWWDTVDWLSKLAGIHFRHYPELQKPYCEKWINSENIWLQRAAIIHQLFYRKETDSKLLFDLIARRAGSKEFFIRKASGWALRQYSKTDPKAVIDFVETHDLSPLTVKEALRLIRKP